MLVDEGREADIDNAGTPCCHTSPFAQPRVVTLSLASIVVQIISTSSPTLLILTRAYSERVWFSIRLIVCGLSTGLGTIRNFPAPSRTRPAHLGMRMICESTSC